MEATVTRTSDVEFELEIRATADELKPEIDKHLRAQRAQAQMKGFRPGKVPMSLVKKLYGEAIALGVVEDYVQKAYNDRIVEGDEHEPIGRPLLTDIDYELDGDLRALVRFGVRPEFELADLSEIRIPRLKLEVTPDLVEEQIEEFRRSNADLVPVDEAASETDQVVIDVQEVDAESGSPIIGRKDEDQQIFLDQRDLPEAWKNGLVGKKAGETFRVEIPHGDDHSHHYEVTVKEVKQRDLPELDDETVKELTNGSAESVDALREQVEKQLRDSIDEQTRELFESEAMRALLERHVIPVPDAALDIYLDSFVEDVKQRNDGKLPDGFDEQAFRNANKGEAERQARWMFIRDEIVKQNDLQVSDEDVDAFFDGLQQNEEFGADFMRTYYERLGLMEQVQQRLMSRKVFDWIATQVKVEDLGEDEYAEAVKELHPELDEAEDAPETTE